MGAKINILFLFLTLSIGLGAQEDESARHYAVYDQLMNDCPNEIGFACGFAGSPTQAISLMDELIKPYRIDLIKELLFSEIPAVQFLAVEVLEATDEELDENYLIRIAFIKNSIEQINYCSGCTVHEIYSLVTLFSGGEQYPVVKSTREYIKRALG